MYTQQKLSSDKLKAIIHKIYMQVPHIMQLIAPDGWKQCTYYQQIVGQQAAEYQLYLDELLHEKKQNNSPIAQNMEDSSYLQEYAIWYEDYFTFQFPRIDQDEGQVFFFMLHLLSDLTQEGLLISAEEVKPREQYHYIDYEDLSRTALEIAYEQQLIEKENLTNGYLRDVPVLVADMDQFHCMQVIFEILETEHYHWHHTDSDLRYIFAAQQEYHDLDEHDIPYIECYHRQNELIQIIQDILRPYPNYGVDPLDFSAILSLFNRHKINYSILAYLHSYHCLPGGYPYQASDYYG
ncbi:hypothetical protein KO02_11510 [Sphingobacterium sp. ML3W]|uniref:hypothetical protein n=1 Tax=Sphingobacterium sp. ML3W TaxID=1538644 RepID=UPI0004F741E8|nr:hypothetical protein [Sphingobacterium sp. ML3W]AIM37247.1 hypothetical protein KO02_11510 [Sphingobacterium sp. ML3W]